MRSRAITTTSTATPWGGVRRERAAPPPPTFRLAMEVDIMSAIHKTQTFLGSSLRHLKTLLCLAAIFLLKSTTRPCFGTYMSDTVSPCP